MQFMGGKYRLAKHLGPIIGESVAKTGRFYEPFLGGNNFYRVIYPVEYARLSDIDGSLITMYKAFLDGWIPLAYVSEELYQLLKDLDDSTDPRTAFAAYGCSFGGKRWGGYARGENGRNYASNVATSLKRTVRPADYQVGNYLDLDINEGTIYCDPPYADTTGYAFEINYETFYDWCRTHTKRGVSVFVSEFKMPENFEVVFERPQPTMLGNVGTKTIEKLFLCR